MRKRKYIVREVPAEHSNFSYYFDDEGLTESGGDYCYNLFIVNHTRNSSGFNGKEYQNIQDEIEEMFEDYNDITNKYEYAQYSSVGAMLLDLGLIDNLHNTKRIKEIKEWLNACQELAPRSKYTTIADTYPEETTAEYLTFRTGKPWKTEEVRGYSQGDMVTLVYCPEHYTSGATAYGEIWLGVGKEFYIIELNENGEEEDTTHGYIVADSQVRNDEDYKTLVCEWAGIPKEETTLELVDGYQTVVTYKEK